MLEETQQGYLIQIFPHSTKVLPKNGLNKVNSFCSGCFNLEHGWRWGDESLQRRHALKRAVFETYTKSNSKVSCG